MPRKLPVKWSDGWARDKQSFRDGRPVCPCCLVSLFPLLLYCRRVAIVNFFIVAIPFIGSFGGKSEPQSVGSRS